VTHDSANEPLETLFTPQEALAQRFRRGRGPNFAPPQGVILCYQRRLLDTVKRRGRAKKVAGFSAELYLLRETDDRVAVAGGFGVGAAAAVVLLEELGAFGVHKFISVGLAGGLQESLQAGDLVVCNRALRDEGPSRHYLPPSDDVLPSSTLNQSIQRALESLGHAYQVGATWTMDAPYRETRQAAERHRREGVKTVEMEAAALFAVGQQRGYHVACAFSVADALHDLQWRLDYDEHKAESGLVALVDAAMIALQEGDPGQA